VEEIRPYYPEDLFKFISFRDMLKRVDAMGEYYRGYYDIERDSQAAFYFAFRDAFERLARFMPYHSSRDFYRDFRERCVKPAGADIDHLIYTYISPYASWLDRHNYEKVCLDPAKLLLAGTDSPGEKRSIPYRKYFDCRRRLAIALQYLTIELADPDAYSSDDLLRIDDLSYELLFDSEEEVEIFTVTELMPSRFNRLRTVPHIFTSRRRANREAKKLRKKGRVIFQNHYLCRVVHAGSIDYIVWASARWKEKRATLLKLERGRDLTDRRGWKYVVVAIRNETPGSLRTAMYGDAVDFSKLCAVRLWGQDEVRLSDREALELYHREAWFGELQLGVDRSKVNHNSHKDYQDVKLVGRFRSVNGSRLTSAQVEQLTLCVGDHEATQTSLDGVNHLIYRGKELTRTLCPLWFQFDVFGIDWPEYPIDDEDRNPRKIIVKNRLERAWRARIEQSLDRP